MSEFVCKKPITLSGRSFSYGEIIPDGFVLPGRALSLVRSNYISEIEGGLSECMEGEAFGTIPDGPIQPQIGITLIAIPISTQKGNLELTMSSESVVTVLTIMQKTVEEAAKDIAAIEDKEALILLNAVDSRTGIQKAAEKRAMQLSEPPNKEGGENEEGPEDTEGGGAVDGLEGTEVGEKPGGESTGDA